MQIYVVFVDGAFFGKYTSLDQAKLYARQARAAFPTSKVEVVIKTAR